MTTQPATPPTPNPKAETTQLLEAIRDGIASLREEIHYLSSLIETTAEPTARTADVLDRLLAALAGPPTAAPAAAMQPAATAPAGHLVFVLDNIVLGYDDKGAPTYRGKGAQYQKFGVRIWPEVLPTLGVDPSALKPGPNAITPRQVLAVLGDSGQPKKITGLATASQPAASAPGEPVLVDPEYPF